MNSDDFLACRMAAEQGDLDAQCALGVMYAQGIGVEKDYAKALEWTRKATLKGHVQAEQNLFLLLPKSPKESVVWGREAAEAGTPDAQWALGCAYMECNDYGSAMIWHRKAAEQGYARSQSLVGLMYDYGKGVAKNYTQAVTWYRKAAEQGDKESEYQMGLMYEKQKDYTKAIVWYAKAANKGHTDALKRKKNLGG